MYPGWRRSTRAAASGPGRLAAVALAVARLGALDRLERGLARVPAVDLDDLPLGRLVDGEEVGDLVAQGHREVVEALDVVPVGIRDRDAEDLVVLGVLVAHAEQRHRLDLDQAAGERRLGHDDHRVERIAVRGEGLAEEAVVGGIAERREQQAVELDRVELVAPLVLVRRALGDLDDDVQGLAHAADPTSSSSASSPSSSRTCTPRRSAFSSLDPGDAPATT